MKWWILRKKKKRPRNPEEKQENKDILKNLYSLFEGRKGVFDVFESKICPIKIEGTGFSDKFSDHSNLKISNPKQMIQRLSIALAQEKAGNTSDNLLNVITQIIYSFYWAKEITKKVYNNMINSIKV